MVGIDGNIQDEHFERYIGISWNISLQQSLSFTYFWYDALFIFDMFDLLVIHKAT